MCRLIIKILLAFLFFILSLCNAQDPTAHHPHRHRHHKFQNLKQWKSAIYPLEVCKDRRYWKFLPNPDGVIGFGYNLMTGRMTSIPLFNSSIYDDSECRLSGRRSSTGIWDMYRLPSYVTTYTFYEETESENLNLRFRYNIYNTTPGALLDAKKSRSLPDQLESIDYDDLYVTLRSAPIRYYSGAKSYYEAIEELAMNSRNIQSQKTDSTAPVLYSLRASATTGDFELKSPEQMHWRHLNEKFRQRLRQAIVDDDFSRSFFDEVGTHYGKRGTFGGISERWWISRRRPERKCAIGEESRILDAGLMAACDRFRLAGQDEDEDVSEKSDNTSSIFSILQSLTDRCHLVFDDERFRTSRWMVTSGAPSERLKSAHLQQAAFSGRSGDVQLRQWLASLNDEPSTIRLQLAPICDLLSLVDERPWHSDRCREQLLAYVKSKDPFYAGKTTKFCSGSEIGLKFEKIGTSQTEFGKIRTQDVNSSGNVYCVPNSVYAPERTCRIASDAVKNSILLIWLGFFSILCWFNRFLY